ncbi:hypothetical protein GGI12_003512, partial [Dipsacomyces acuminosporus]
MSTIHKDNDASSAGIVDATEKPHSKTADLADSADGAKSEKKGGLFASFGKKKEKKEKTPMVPLLQLFRFSDSLDKVLMIIGTIAAMAAGTAMPLMTLIFAEITQKFLEFHFGIGGFKGESARRELDHLTRRYCLYFLALGLGMWVVSTLLKLLWSIAAERLGKRVREAFYTSILRQDIGWFDDVSTGELTTRISGDVNMLQEGTGEKAGFVIQYVCTFLTGIILAFVKGWKLTLVVLAVIPVLIGSASVMGILLAESAAGGQNSYAEAGGVADEVLSSIKTVMAFGGEERELKRYDEKIKKARTAGLRKAIVVGCCMGFFLFSIYSIYALAFWFGGKLARNGEMDAGTVLNVFFSLIVGGFSLGNAAPSISAVASARGAAVKVYEVIDRKSPIDP